MSLLEIVLYLMVAFVGGAIVFSRRPINQLFIYSMYGGLMTLLFFVLHAPDVALSELTVGTLLIPLMVLVTMMRTGNVP